jgi:hypothetical protein
MNLKGFLTQQVNEPQRYCLTRFLSLFLSSTILKQYFVDADGLEFFYSGFILIFKDEVLMYMAHYTS